jgi:large subunit ribosomal protein L30e
MTIEDEIKAAITADKVIIGTKEVVKAIKNGAVKKVVVASNMPEDVYKDIEHYNKVSKLDVNKFNGTGKQLGVFCGKPFSISVVAIKK